MIQLAGVSEKIGIKKRQQRGIAPLERRRWKAINEVGSD